MAKSENKKPFVSPIGGQALLEGVMMKSPTTTAMAVRDVRGDLVVYSERNKKGRKWYHKTPVVRGVVSFVSSLIDSIKYLTKSIEPLGEEEEQLSKGETTFSVILGVVLAVGIFAVLPRLTNWAIFDKWLNLSVVFEAQNYFYVLITSATSGIIRVGILILYMWIISKMKSIYRMYQYHGAEHRTINCYEKHLPLTVENVQSCSTRHNRCGTTFLFYTVIMSMIISVIVAFLLALWGVDVNTVKAGVGESFGTLVYNLILIGSNLVMLPVTAGLSYEFLRLMAKAPDNKFFMIFKAPGLALQKLSTKLPDDSMAEAAILAFNTVMELDKDKALPELDFYEMTMPAARKILKEKYAAAGIDEECEQDWMLRAVLDKPRAELHNVERLTAEQGKKLMEWASRRSNGEPLDYITGYSEFYGLKIKVDKNVLIPRMDTETVVGEALKIIGDKKLKVLDLMTGSGCIALAIAKNSSAAVTASDISDDALAVAKENLTGGVTLIKSDGFESVSGKFGLIISNPPYIKSGEIAALQKEVQAQPILALDGGEDGLDFYRMIAKRAPGFLEEGGSLVLEIGCDQAEDVSALLAESFTDIKVYKDLGGNDRTVTAALKK